MSATHEQSQGATFQWPYWLIDAAGVAYYQDEYDEGYWRKPPDGPLEYVAVKPPLAGSIQ